VPRKKVRKVPRPVRTPAMGVDGGLTAAQQAVQEQMRRALEEDQYSAVGSIVDTDSEDDGEEAVSYHNTSIRLDKTAMMQAVRKCLQQQASWHNNSQNNAKDDEDNDEENEEMDEGDEKETSSNRRGGSKTRKKKKHPDGSATEAPPPQGSSSSMIMKDPLVDDDDLDRDGGSIFGATTGSSNNSTWVECDKCKKWRRLRGVVDEKKLPSKWYCSMNKNDPERARCAAPEEEYETSHTPESAADSRTRKHLRVWVRRLQCNEAYEGRQPTLTRGKKRTALSSSAKGDPYEWVRCCNPSCGKWRALLRMMEAKSIVAAAAADNGGEWYCVMNHWDEKTASCAAPQENLPAVGCPPWVLQDNANHN
jgi:CW-type Zinc Finger